MERNGYKWKSVSNLILQNISNGFHVNMISGFRENIMNLGHNILNKNMLI